MPYPEENIQEIPLEELNSQYFTQSKVWANIKSSTGWTTHAFTQKIYPTLEPQYLIFIKKLSFLGYLAYIPNGLLSLHSFFRIVTITQKKESQTNTLDNKVKINMIQEYITQALEILSCTHMFLKTTYKYKLISIRWDIPPVIEINNSIASIYKPQQFFKQIQQCFHSIVEQSSTKVQYRLDLQDTTQTPATVLIHLNKINKYKKIEVKTNEELLLQCKKKTRYNIRLAQKNDIKIKKYISLDDFYALLQVTAKRNKISIHSLNYFNKLSYTIQQEKTMELIIYGAYFKEQLISTIMVLYQYDTILGKLDADKHFKESIKDYSAKENIEQKHQIHLENERDINTSANTMYQDVPLHSPYDTDTNSPEYNEYMYKNKGIATYLYGASSNKHRELMSTYLLQWYAIVDAKLKKCEYYDLYGISHNNTHKTSENRLLGLYKFKTGFTKNIWIRPFAVDIYERNISSHMRKYLFNTLNKIRLWYYHKFKKNLFNKKNNNN